MAETHTNNVLLYGSLLISKLKRYYWNLKILIPNFWLSSRLPWILTGFFRLLSTCITDMCSQIHKLSLYTYQLQTVRKAVSALTPGNVRLLSDSPSVWSVGSRTKPIILGSFSSLSPESSQMVDLTKAKRKISFGDSFSCVIFAFKPWLFS